MPSHYEKLLGRIKTGQAVVGVVGMGYVGLPLSIAFCDAGSTVIGFDVDEDKCRALNAGTSYIEHLPSEMFAEHVSEGRLTATSSFTRLAEVDAILICVPTPLGDHREPDLSYVEATVESIVEHGRAGQLVVLESTTYPGTTATILGGRLARAGLVDGETVFLAYSPEREDPSNPNFTTRTIPKVVGADTPEALELASLLYGKVIVRIVQVDSAATAEAVKLTENVFRSVNIALVNELKLVFDRMGIDVWKVLEAAATKPFGYMPFYPGPGLGGHCIPIDPFYLAWKAREYDLSTRFIELAGEINTSMPRFVVEKLTDALSDRLELSAKGSKILVLGVGYKRNLGDDRESPAYKIMDLLEAKGATVTFHDPHVARIGRVRAYPQLEGRSSQPLTAQTLEAADAVLVCTAHDAVDYALVSKHAGLIIDTRNAFANLPSHNVVKA